ncbi:ABC transporter permease [Candidatus Pacearchaeota archaeon]|nr:ABC transporter permease [Candidatus Pacearchaeota archaeon]
MKSQFITLAVRNLWKRKVRSLLTVLGITLAVATIFILVSISLGLQSGVEEQFRKLGTDKFFIFPKGQVAGPGTDSAATLTDADVTTLEKIPGVKGLSYFKAGNAKIQFNDEVRFFTVVGFPLEKERAQIFSENGAFKPEEGRELKEGDTYDIVIGSQYKYNAVFSKSVKLGDRFEINTVEFKVRGITETQGNPQDDRIILMPLEIFKEVFGDDGTYDEIIVQVEDSTLIQEVADRIERRLRSARDVTEKTQDFTIITPEELLGTFGSVLGVLTVFLVAIATISVVVGAIGIANTMYASVLERTKEIGTMKALGAHNAEILSLFILEASMLGLIGGSAGILIGASGAYSLEYVATNVFAISLVQAAFPLSLFLSCAGFAIFIGVLAGALPAYRASKLNTVDALRYE